MSEVDWNKDVNRAQEAKRILSSPLVIDAFKGMRADIYAAIEESKSGNEAAREQAYYQLRAIKSFEGQFKRVIEKGKKSANLLEQAARKIKRLVEHN